jgi:hypothetical protein
MASNTEKMRIYRSIYRYVIYGNLFYLDHRRPGVVKVYLPSGQNQSHSFLTLFPAWQGEELSCVNDFIQDKILEKWQEVEDNFYAFSRAIHPSGILIGKTHGTAAGRVTSSHIQ